MEDDSFVMFGSVVKHIERIEKVMGPDMAYNVYKAVKDYGIYNITPPEDDEIWVYGGLEQVFISIDAAKNRRRKQKANGSKGGREQVYNRNEITRLKQQGLTNKQVAEEIGCSEKTVERNNVLNRQNGHNLNVNDNVNINDNVKERLHQGYRGEELI